MQFTVGVQSDLDRNIYAMKYESAQQDYEMIFSNSIYILDTLYASSQRITSFGGISDLCPFMDL